VDGSCKDGKMGSWCCKLREEGAGKCARIGRDEEGTSSNRPELGGVVLAVQSAALTKTSSCCEITRQFCVLLRNGWDKEEKQR
jgi:hypothetical protein